MINVIAPPGCFGTYISRCLYHYTNLGFSAGWQMDFDAAGSSHAFRSINTDKIQKPANLHHDWSKMPNDKSNNVVIYAHADHRLDYYDNQFIKQDKGRLINHLLLSFTMDEISHKLQTQWGYVGPLNEEIPRWIAREFISFWLKHTLEDGYDKSKYLDLPHVKSFCCQDLFERDCFMMLSDLCHALNLDLIETSENVRHNHMTFLSVQRFHNMQIKCENFIESCLDTTDCAVMKSPCVTIFDEAFVQYRLRETGWDIECNELFEFPSDSSRLRHLMCAL